MDDGGRGDGGGTDPCPGAPLSDLVDPFDELGVTWEVVGVQPDCVVTIDTGALFVDNDSSAPCGVQTEVAHAFYDQAVAIRIDGRNQDDAGSPDIAFAISLVGWSAMIQYREEATLISNCPDGTNCGTVETNETLPSYWRLRHDPELNAILIGFSEEGDLFSERAPLELGDDADPTCASVFIGSRGTTTGTLDIAIDGVNVE